MRGVEAAGFVDPRPIQIKTIPAVHAGRDVLGLAQTGTGKTAAFVLPILEHLIQEPRPIGPRALIVAPTRELALQIEREVKVLAKFTPLSTAVVIGGVAANPQVRALRNQPEIVIACPGRLLDLYEQGVLTMRAVEVFVLDEADHMFDMGFLPDVRRILHALPPKRQNLMFSATMPKEIRALADRLLVDPVAVELGNSAPAETIEHALYPVSSTRKLDLLAHLLDENSEGSAIVFARTKHRVKRLAEQLERLDFSAIGLQGNMSQPQRERAMKGFRNGRFDVLVATDIAARGIDVAQVDHVINFDVPDVPDAYTHRIGRTGRSERSGRAYTLVTPEDSVKVRAIERSLGAKIPRCEVKEFAAVEPPARASDRPAPRGNPSGAGSSKQRPGTRGGGGGNRNSRGNSNGGHGKSNGRDRGRSRTPSGGGSRNRSNSRNRSRSPQGR